MMNGKQYETYTAALARAISKGLEVTGKGSRKSDGATVYTVTSASESGRWHLVAIEGAHLSCDCKAGQHGVMCMHRALVHAHLLGEASRKAQQTPAPVAAPRRPADPNRQSIMNRTRAFSLMA